MSCSGCSAFIFWSDAQLNKHIKEKSLTWLRFDWSHWSYHKFKQNFQDFLKSWGFFWHRGVTVITIAQLD